MVRRKINISIQCLSNPFGRVSCVCVCFRIVFMSIRFNKIHSVVVVVAVIFLFILFRVGVKTKNEIMTTLVSHSEFDQWQKLL